MVLLDESLDRRPVREIWTSYHAELGQVPGWFLLGGVQLYASATTKKSTAPKTLFSVITEYGPGETLAEHFFTAPGRIPEIVLADEQRLAARVTALPDSAKRSPGGPSHALLIGKVPPPTNAPNLQACVRICRHTACPQLAAHIGILSVVRHAQRPRRDGDVRVSPGVAAASTKLFRRRTGIRPWAFPAWN
ncbi:hypothetical protein [Streptomyces sp. NBC_01304]|uniref:hypothetical protein n=1 Tax=Streptomyces sp. NBC_01304 TaxID=2903818 RepID=UPI002E164853|nr:hypothetical protein OG430_41530 [Streptomyces sp. NBC_01304]